MGSTRTAIRREGHWTVAVVAGMASLLDSAAIIAVGSSLVLWRAEFDLDDWTVGLISAAMTLSIAFGALTGGRIADHVGRHRVFAATIACYAGGAALVATAASATQLVVGVAVLGFTGGADLPASLSLVAEYAAAHRCGRMVAFTHVLWTMGVLIGSAAALLVSGHGITGMRWVFAALALAAVCTLVARRRCRPFRVDAARPPRQGAATQVHGWRALWRAGPQRRLILAIGGFYVLFTLVSSTFGNFRAYFLVEAGGATQTTATAIAFAVTCVGLMGTVVFSAIADTPWRRRAYPLGATLLIGSQILIAVTGGTDLSWTVVALVVYSLGYPFVGEALYKVWSQESFPQSSRATAQGVTIAAARVSTAAFALVTPRLITASPALLFALTAVFATGAVALGLLVPRRGA